MAKKLKNALDSSVKQDLKKQLENVVWDEDFFLGIAQDVEKVAEAYKQVIATENVKDLVTIQRVCGSLLLYKNFLDKFNDIMEDLTILKRISVEEGL